MKNSNDLPHVGFEAILWYSLVAFQCIQDGVLAKDVVGALSSFITVLHLTLRILLLLTTTTTTEPTKNKNDNKNGWRKPNGTDKMRNNGDPCGMYMSIALVPTLLQAMGHGTYALLFSVLSWFCWTGRFTVKTLSIILCFLFSYLVILFLPSASHDSNRILQDEEYLNNYSAIWKNVLFCTIVWCILYKSFTHCYYRNIAVTMTKGEWIVVSELTAVAFTEFVFWKNVTSTKFLYAYTALAGLFGCGLACGLADAFLLAKRSVVFRLFFVVTVALGTVEGCFWYQQAAYPFPKCLWWIFGDFLMAVETTTPPHDDILQRFFLPSNELPPRMAWLAYWAVTMLVTIPLAPPVTNNNTSSSCSSTILARKWFHLVAVLLFVPATVAAPELQTLSYAVALAVLLLLESTRHHVPWLNDFYRNYLDASKDETHDSTIVSHMALIAGCAAPLWLSEWLYHHDDDDERAAEARLLVQLWGVWTLGIGDAMGAVIGKNFGHHHWGQQRRTVEGSVAMFLSLSLACAATTMWLEHHPGMMSLQIWLPAVVFVTLLEAFTLQIDNLVLPLAGTAVIFVSTRTRSV